MVDEYGGIVGIITLYDLFEAIVGDLPEEDEEINILRREDGSYLVNGKTTVIEINQYFGRDVIEKDHSRYTTISGYILDRTKAIPKTGEKVDFDQLSIEIVDMDGLRIDKLLIFTKNTIERE